MIYCFITFVSFKLVPCQLGNKKMDQYVSVFGRQTAIYHYSTIHNVYKITVERMNGSVLRAWPMFISISNWTALVLYRSFNITNVHHSIIACPYRTMLLLISLLKCSYPTALSQSLWIGQIMYQYIIGAASCSMPYIRSRTSNGFQ